MLKHQIRMNCANRRRFLELAGTVATACLTPSRFAAEAAPRTLAKAPSARPRLFSGCCAYSYKRYFETDRMTMEDFILKAVELGIEGVDITTYWLKSTEPPYLSSLRHLAFKNSVAFSGTAIGGEMCQSDPARRAHEVEEIKKWVDATEFLGASHIRVSGGRIPPGATLEQAIQWTAEAMKAACDYAGRKGITLGIENHNHGRVTERASTIIEILRRVDSPYAGINLDITNFPEDAYAQIEACIPYATHAHIRDVFYYENNRPVDLNRIFRLCARGSYKGYMSAEYTEDENEGDPMTAAPRLIAKIKTLSKEYSST